MPRGGARNRSGPAPDPKSRTSERKGYSLTALPAAGYDGPIPAWPLPTRVVWHEWFEDKRKVRENDEAVTEAVAEREAELWQWAWSTPQACAWSMPSESWRLIAIAHWVRTAVLCESSEATAADKNSLHRFADQIGLSPAGLKENGWKVVADELAGRRDDAPAAEPETPAPAPARRMRAVGDGS